MYRFRNLLTAQNFNSPRIYLTTDLVFRKANFLLLLFSFQIDKNLMQTEGMVARVRREVEIHSRLKHPSILEVCFFFDGNLSLWPVSVKAMNYVERKETLKCIS